MQDQRSRDGQNLLNRFDQDPGPFIPFTYQTRISVPVIAGHIGRGQITTNQQPYIWTRISQQIVGNTGDPESSGLYQDGQYTIGYKDELVNYIKEPVMAEMLAGSVRSGFIAWLAMPVPLAGTRTITFEIENLVDRILSPEATHFQVAIAIHGMTDRGRIK